MFKEEKRRHFRKHFERQVKLAFFTEFYDQCQVQNISFGGLFVQGQFPYKAGDQCYVIITHSGKSTRMTFRALAEIVRHEEEGIALRFLSMSFESLVLLELILLYEQEEMSSGKERKLPTDLPFELCEEEPSLPENIKHC